MQPDETPLVSLGLSFYRAVWRLSRSTYLKASNRTTRGLPIYEP